MSGPSSRTRHKKPKPDSGDDILRRIQSTEMISQEDIHRFFHLDRPECQCRTNAKDNPLCLCGLVPSTGTRKAGLWQKQTDVTQELGPDPSSEQRTDLAIPAGLTNLGATCYVNSVLQCLYMNTDFRDGVFAAEMELVKNDPVLHELAKLFALLHSGKKSSVDSAPFAKILELDNAIQQDGQEFLKLLLSLLEGVLEQSRVSEARNVVQNLFRGTYSFVTRCSRCGKDSSASSNHVNFYEIELNVKGIAGLEESLEDYLSEEKLEGENQYSCEFCKCSVDATRSTKLRTLPQILNFQLKRFVFNPKTATKKKVTSKFSFPRVLDMRLPIMSEAPVLYDLFAILIHKGNAATSGHYVAHIRDERSGQWWQFDDEQVSDLGVHPLGDDRGKSKDGDQNMLMSADAYMLMYSRKRDTSSGGLRRNIPEFLTSEVEEFNEAFLNSCDVFQMMRDDEVTRISDRKDEVRTILATASARPLASESFWILAEWLRTWADSLDPPSAIDNSQLLCEHKCVSFKKVHLMKYISETAWRSLQAKYGGGPELSLADCCLKCIYAEADAAASAQSFRTVRAGVKEMVENVLAGEKLEGELFYVSKTWLTQWLRKKIVDAPMDSDAHPTGAITCPHSGLLPEQAPNARRQIIPEQLWTYFHQNALRVNKDKDGCKPFPINTDTCCICEVELAETTCKQEDLRATKLEQRQKLEAIFSGRGLVLVPKAVYYLVPCAWVSQWRAYVGASGRNVLDIEEPEGLEGLVLTLLCEKHGGLLFKPPLLTRTKRGEHFQKSSPDDVFTVVSEEDWLSFCKQWNVDASKGIKAFLEVHDDRNGKRTSTFDSALPVLRTEPEVCRECLGDRESTELIHKLNYTDETISVELVQGSDPPPALLASPTHAQDADKRASKRSRRTLATGNKRVALTVSGTTTVYQLKMLIWELLGVVKENQEVHFGRVELTDELATLADLSIFPGSVLWVTDTGIYEHRDIAEELSAKQDQVEEGFRGTRLFGSGFQSSDNQLMEEP